MIGESIRSFFDVLKAGNSVRDDIVSSLLGIISTSPELHGYVAKQLYKLVRGESTQQPLVQVACWVLGKQIRDSIFTSTTNCRL